MEENKYYKILGSFPPLSADNEIIVKCVENLGDGYFILEHFDENGLYTPIRGIEGWLFDATNANYEEYIFSYQNDSVNDLKTNEMGRTKSDTEDLRIENKVTRAKELGIKFKLIGAGQGVTTAPYDTINVLPEWTNDKFERELDEVIKRLEDKTFLTILKNAKVI